MYSWGQGWIIAEPCAPAMGVCLQNQIGPKSQQTHMKRTYMRVFRPAQRVRRGFRNEGVQLPAFRVVHVHWWCSLLFRIPLSSRGRGARINLRRAYRSSIREDIDDRVCDAEPVVDTPWHAEVGRRSLENRDGSLEFRFSDEPAGIADRPSSSSDCHSAKLSPFCPAFA